MAKFGKVAVNLLQVALKQHQAGRLIEAERLYRAVLASQPDNADALHLLGLCLINLKRRAEGVPFVRRALEVQPNFPKALATLGNALSAEKDLAGAFAAYEAALELVPDFYEVLVNRANVLEQAKFYREALAGYDKALAAGPRLPTVVSNRGNTLRALKRLDEALACQDEALAAAPHDGIIWCNKGVVLREMERLDEALACYDRAMALLPEHPVVLTNRGNVLQRLDRFDEALAAHDRALAIWPNYASAHSNRATALHALQRIPEAIDAYRQALALEPDVEETLSNLGNLLSLNGRQDEAKLIFERLVEVAPEHDFALGLFFNARLAACDWRDYEHHVTTLGEAVARDRNVVLPFDALTWMLDPQVELDLATSFVARHCPAQPPIWRGEYHRHDRLRIAYVGHDFHEHVTPQLMAGVFEAHDRSRFETFAFSMGAPRGDAMERRLRCAFEHFLDLSEAGSLAAARLMREHEIDIAIDLKGHTHASGSAFLAHRPAPIQANYLAYPGTTGAPYIDYLLADEFIVPETHRQFYSEQIVYLPVTYQPNDDRRGPAGEPPTRAEAGLPEQGFVFCSFNKAAKINPAMFDVWMRLLRVVPGSVLWLLMASPAVRDNLRQEAAARGVDPARLVFAPLVPPARHLARQQLADLFLDCFPFNAHTTASDALWAGLPLLTCAGQNFASRVAGSVLRTAGLPELVTHSLTEYEAVARDLALQPGRLDTLKDRLRRSRAGNPLFDTRRFTRELEQAFLLMQERHERGLAPAHIMVPRAD